MKGVIGLEKDKILNKKFNSFTMELRLRGYSIMSIKAYLYYNREFLRFVDKHPRKVRIADVKNYLNHLMEKHNAKSRTVNLARSALKCYYDEFYHKRLFNYIKRMKQEKHIPVVLSKEHIKRMIESTDNLKHKIVIDLLYGSGLRVGECVRLKIVDLNLGQRYGIIRLGKGNKDRFFRLSDTAKNDIELFLVKRRDNNPYLFPNRLQGHITIETAQMVVKNAARKAGIKSRVFCHALRASYATHLNEDKIELEDIQKLMGHADSRTTLCYIKRSEFDLPLVKSPLDKISF